jgi:glutamyl/glutaminyl-tRNA synthetase
MVSSSDRSKVYSDYLDMIDPKYLKRDDGCIRLDIPKDMIRDNWKDCLTRKSIKTHDFNRDNICNMVLIKSDGTPTYHFQSVVDDIDLGINCIIRGTDHIGNTLRQITIFDLFDKTIPDFHHVGLIHNMLGKKYSKRDGATSITDYRDMGYGRDALLNFMLRIGWSPRDPNMNGLIDTDTAVDLFWGSGKMSNSSAKMDMKKLDWYNGKYLSKKVL